MLLIADDCQIRFLGTTYEGNWHDKAMADQEAYVLPAGTSLYQDLGFQSFAVAGVTIQQPTKKPCGGELTPGQRAVNRRIASTRMRIEHVIDRVEQYRIVKDKLRL